MSINKKQMMQHKQLLHGSRPTIFQVFPEKGSPLKPKVFSGTMKECGPKIEAAVQEGLAVAIALNEFRDGVRKTESIERVVAFFVDLDGGVTVDQINKLPKKPHILTETSPRHYHAAWLVSGCPIHQYRHVQMFLARKLGGDSSVTDLTRTMRLAGTINRKNGQHHRVKIVWIAQGGAATPIEFSEFLRAFGMRPKRKPTPQNQARVEDVHGLEDVRAALEKIPAEQRSVWLNVGMALHSLMPNAKGKAIWDEWSEMAADKFDQQTQDRTWRNFKATGGVTKGTLFYYANQFSTGTTQVDMQTTESDLAKRFVATCKGEVAYDHHTSTWWVFDCVWKKSHHLALRRCKAMLESMMDTVRSGQTEKPGGLMSAIQRQSTTAALTAILRHAALDSALEISASGFDANPDLLGVANGVVELNSGMHRAARPDDLITLQCGVAYDPLAKCSVFLAFIDSIAEGDKAFAQHIQRAMGYSVFGHTREQVFFMITGPGANGKGVLLRTINKVLGDYGKTVAPNLLRSAYASNPNSPSPAVMALKGARLYACTEFDGKKSFDEAFIKQLSGSDVLTGRSNFGEQETFTPVGKLWLSLNSDPEIAHDNAAMWRRVCVIPLLRRFSGKDCDPELEVKLANELPGILTWLITGARQYHEHGLGVCRKVTNAKAELRLRSDTVRSWFMSCCAKRNAAAIQGASDVFNSYKAHTRNNGRTPLTIGKFNERLEKLGYEHVRRSAFNGWKGFILKGD
ncbi:phage/plasmid primase, P4 family [Paraburkholderia phenazinium]|uniref:phage/plasmid primase, P4 family n=1 Tax=Paraburkholderia phenazinium TaxID=60549 RepID=UPI00158D92CC|nr:phage/plasmid primase, P4 family [Paraburkholderia phenazinium]